MLQSKRSNGLLRWWWSIDSTALLIVLSIILIGLFLNATASPAVANRIGVSYFHFLNRQLIFLLISLCIITILALIDKKYIKVISMLGFVITIALMVLVLFIGDEAKGARRWLNILGFSLQPSELLKPFYIILIALILSKKDKELHKRYDFKKLYLCLLIHVIILSLLLLQPDFGMAMTISIVTAGQLFVSGLPIILVVLAVTVLCGSIVSAYYVFPHVARRIESFLNPDNHANYQVEKSIESYVKGGFFGKGPGEGSIKMTLPDSHTDFIFAVAGEEMGIIFCIIVVALFISFLVRGMLKMSQSKDLFEIYAIIGVLMYFGIQSVFNIGVTLHLFPTKGMTLPFISYGGSSAICFAILTGLYLSLTKKSSINSQYYLYGK